jgi:hypothetical protein
MLNPASDYRPLRPVLRQLGNANNLAYLLRELRTLAIVYGELWSGESEHFLRNLSESLNEMLATIEHEYRHLGTDLLEKAVVEAEVKRLLRAIQGLPKGSA